MQPNFGGLLIIVLCVVTGGLAISSLCDMLGRPYLFVVRGTRARLLSWLGALAVGALLWVALIHLVAGLVALAIFFGFEAITLDVFVHRILYLPQSAPVPVPVPVRVQVRD